jgi:hypothetical protein
LCSAQLVSKANAPRITGGTILDIVRFDIEYLMKASVYSDNLKSVTQLIKYTFRAGCSLDIAIIVLSDGKRRQRIALLIDGAESALRLAVPA